MRKRVNGKFERCKEHLGRWNDKRKRCLECHSLNMKKRRREGKSLTYVPLTYTRAFDLSSWGVVNYAKAMAEMDKGEEIRPDLSENAACSLVVF